MKISLVRARYHSVWEPQALMNIAAYVKYLGYDDVKIYDAFFESDDFILNKIKDSDIVGFSGTTPQLNNMLHLARSVKALNPNIITVLGGFAVSLEPQKVLPVQEVDHIVLGEGETAFAEIVERGKMVPRIVSHQPVANLDDLPDADRDCLDLEQYIRIAALEENRRVTSVITQRGCAFGCTFCAEGKFGTIWRKIDMVNDAAAYGRPERMRLRSPRRVVSEMIAVRDKFKIDFFKTSDAETNPTKSHFINLCKEMVTRKLDTPWGCNMRADKLDDEMCEWAVKANCEEFWIGLESGADEVHKEINKGVTVSMIRNAFNTARKHGIVRRMYGFIGTPVETMETIKKTEALIDELDPDVFGMCVLCPYPGTAYWRPDFEKIDWSQVDEYANTFWHTKHLTNEQLRNEQARLMDKYQHKLARNFKKKLRDGIIHNTDHSQLDTGRVLDSIQVPRGYGNLF